jgi:DNA-binding transcriptional regulator YhcF (GntR family)
VDDAVVRIRLDASSSTPLSAQLRDGLAAEIASGRLLPGDRVSTVRELAARLGLAPNTVARAYRELEAAGLLVGRGRHGTFVAERLPERPTRAAKELERAATAYARRARQLGTSRLDALAAVRRALDATG